MKYSFYILISLLAISSLSSCDKYEDGPGFSLRTRKARMVNTWRIDRAYDDDQDVTEDYDNYRLDLGKSGSATLSAKYSIGNVDFTGETNGSWDFVNDMEDLKLDFENDDFDETYTILKLEHSSLWLREKGNDLELHLIPR